MQHGTPNASLGPTAEAHVDRVPLSVSLTHVAPEAANPQDVQHSIEIQPVISCRPSMSAALRRKAAQSIPILRRSDPRDPCLHFQKAVLNQNSTRLGIPFVNTTQINLLFLAQHTCRSAINHSVQAAMSYELSTPWTSCLIAGSVGTCRGFFSPVKAFCP